MHIVLSYFIYLAIGLALTAWAARTLERNGRVLLVDAFQGNAELASSVNRVLVAGVYLVGVGYVTLFFSTYRQLDTVRAAAESVLDRIGGLLLVLGIVHFLILFVFRRILSSGRERPGHARAAQGVGGWGPNSAPLGKVLE